MGYFAWPYRVLFSDAQAPDWHHFLANFRFQCEAREHFFFAHVLSTPEARAECEDLLLAVHEGYSRNLAPVSLGDTVGILMSYEDVTSSSMRCCFRVVRSDGTPVACGFQKLVCLSRATGHLRPAPQALARHAGSLREPLWSPSFSERVLSGLGLSSLFDAAVVGLGRDTATGSRPGGMSPAVSEAPSGPVVFTFASPATIDPGLLASLGRTSPTAPALLARAAQITGDVLGIDLRPLNEGTGALEHLRRHPELADIAGPLAGLLTARLLQDRGARPDIVVGYGAGEIAAAAAAGLIGSEAAVEAAVHRVRALRPATALGGLRVLACPATRTRALLGALAPSTLEIAIVEGPEETVVSGRHADLARLDALAEHFGIGHAAPGAAAPVHSRLVMDAVAPWTQALRALRWRPAERPVYSAVDRAPYPSDVDMPAALAGNLVRPLPLHEALLDLAARGSRIFIECGPGSALTGLVRAALSGTPGLTAVAALDPPARIAESLPRAVEACGVKPSAPAVPPARPMAASVAAPRDTRLPERAGPTPIAVVGLGCILPGALDPDQLWQRVLEARTCLTDEPPYDVREFLSSGPMPVSDKSYACLGGWARGFAPGKETPPFGTVTQQHLAAALRQSLDGIAGPRVPPDRVQVLLGSTGDGCREYDESLLLASLAHPPPGAFDSARLARWTRALETAVGRATDESQDTSPWLLYQAVAEELVGAGVRVLALDAACASALYALGTAVRALDRGECDLAVAGGVFHPGAGNACLFAQFGGLSRTGSHPLDARADGVVFSEGTALLALKRLDDALAAGDTVHAVIRGVSWSSDGRSPSVMEPREAGQVLAMARAYEACGIDPGSVQFLEAHATATPVGDAVEIGAATKVFPRGPSPLAIGSVKAVFGHTGWAAGATSAIKMIKSLETRTLPPQADFSVPNPRLAAEGTRFEVLTRSRPWPDNGGAPRRAAINGFGFGGSNAHLVLEEFDAARPRAASAAASLARPEPVAIVAAVPLLPVRGAAFERSELSLPDSVLILPDVVDHMDRAQTLALLAGARVLGALPGWKTMAEDAGIVLGIEGKTGRGVDASVRVFRDWLKARLDDDPSLPADDRAAFRAHVDATADAIAASGPYTLLGLMPNVVAGRIANAFNLKGPNLVVDAHRGSLAAALDMAAGWVESGERPLVLAGAIHASAHPAFASLVHASARVPEGRPIGEAALLLALAPARVAAEKGWPVLALLERRPLPATPELVVGGRGHCLLGAEGTFEIVSALASVRAGAARAQVAWPSGPSVTFLAAAPVGEAMAPDAMASAANAGRTERPWPA